MFRRLSHFASALALATSSIFGLRERSSVLEVKPAMLKGFNDRPPKQQPRLGFTMHRPHFAPGRAMLPTAAQVASPRIPSNQRQIRKNRRRANAAGCKSAFKK